MEIGSHWLHLTALIGDSMASLEERLDSVKQVIQTTEFLEGKGLSNEVNIRIFCYDPKDEMVVRHFISGLKDEKLHCNLIEYDLYEMFLQICDSKRLLDKIPMQEEKRGQSFLKDYFTKNYTAKMFAERMQYDNHKVGDIIILTGVGKVFPFMRVHALLEAMQPLFTDVPILVFYPGEFDGHYLKLFDKLKPNEYYRAFSTM